MIEKIFESKLWDYRLDKKGKQVASSAFAWCVCLQLLFIYYANYISPRYQVVLNRTPSLPGLIYLIKKGEIGNKNEIVAFTPVKNRFFPEEATFIKYVLGKEGDIVRFDKSDVYINEVKIVRAKQFAKNGMLLKTGTEGKIPHGYFYLGTTMVDGFDSRYEDIGWIPADGILGRAVRIF